jgi:thiosulfate/3-mercaptopyruvate sulfurtransferase
MCLATLCVCAAFAGAVTRAAQPEPPIVVTPTWLAQHLQDADLVVLHVATLRGDYDREHIPGARFLWSTSLAGSTPEQSVAVPDARTAERVLEQLGVSDRSRIVLCHVLGDVAAAARIYVTLEQLGLGDRTFILDGGLEAWKAEGRPVTRETFRHRRGTLTLKPRGDVIADVEFVAARYRQPGVRLVDARSPQGFNAPGGAVVRGGHIPGAVNLPFTSLTDSTDRYRPLDSLRVRFERAGVQPGDEIITYCNVGRTASPVYVAAKMLGYTVRLYDGSFEEWSRREDLPVEGKSVK